MPRREAHLQWLARRGGHRVEWQFFLLPGGFPLHAEAEIRTHSEHPGDLCVRRQPWLDPFGCGQSGRTSDDPHIGGRMGAIWNTLERHCARLQSLTELVET